MNMSQQTRHAFNLMIQGMCKSCKLKNCNDCLYLEQAFNGDTEQIVKYLAMPHKKERR